MNRLWMLVAILGLAVLVTPTFFPSLHPETAEGEATVESIGVPNAIVTPEPPTSLTDSTPHPSKAQGSQKF